MADELTDETVNLPISSLAEALKTRKLSAVELCTSIIELIDTYNPKLNAYVYFDPDYVLEQAKNSDKRISKQHAGPLEGIPIGLKDNIDCAGMPTRAGTIILSDKPINRDAKVVEQLKSMGAIIIGKHNMHELAFGASTINPHYGATKNPWDSTKIAGGSSGGSASAVAARLACAALATDTAGSIRNPAALCGCFGIKPTRGLIPIDGVVPLTKSLCHVGLITRWVEDAQLLFYLLLGNSVKFSYNPKHVLTRFDQVSLLIPTNHFFDPIADSVKLMFDDFVSSLASKGAQVRYAPLPVVEAAYAANLTIMVAEATYIYRNIVQQHADKLGEDVRVNLRTGSLVTAVDLLKAYEIRELVKSAWAEIFREYDFVITPTLPGIAPSIDEPAFAYNKASELISLATVRMLGPYNVAGIPAATIPIGFINGLPVGIQIAAAWGMEMSIFDFTKLIENEGIYNPNITPRI